MGTTRQAPPAQTLLPVVARHETTCKQRLSSTLDCVQFVFVRAGTMLARLGKQTDSFPVPAGVSLLIAPGTDFECQPEGEVELTTLLIDTDYLIEHLFWQHLTLIPDRDAARELAAKLYPDPVQVLRLGEREVERLGPILDELVTLTETSQSAAGYFRTHALLFTALEAITPHIHRARVEIPPLASRERAARIAPPRWRAFRPLRREAARAAALMRSDIATRWRLEDLAVQVSLSPSQFCRVFADSFGVSPLAYLTMLRVQEMARLLRTTDLSMRQICPLVGWKNSTHPPRHFRRYMGVNPSEYRRYGPPSASHDGPGIGVARAARATESKA